MTEGQHHNNITVFDSRIHVGGGKPKGSKGMTRRIKRAVTSFAVIYCR